MKEVSEVIACVIDHGMFMPVAEKLAEQMAKVYYYTPWEKGFADIKDCTIGDGLQRIERLNDFLKEPKFSEIDMFVFPNIMHSGLQEHLEASGKAVWGSRSADELEVFKGRFYRMLQNVGLEVPKHKEIRGLDKLRELLKEEDDLYIKISFFRETMDTWHHIDYAHSEGYLDVLACKLGPFKNEILFYVLNPIDTEIEGGIDNYCIDGKWPDYAVLGYEKKNETYLAVVRPFTEMPEEFLVVNEAVAPVLKQYRYRNFFSTEVRVKGKKSYFIDPTCRTPSPAGEEQLELYGNIGEIIWKGAQGELVQPKIVAEFAGESLVHHTGSKDQWRSLRIPEDVRKWVKLYGCAELDGVNWWPPSDEDVIGCIVGIGNTIDSVIHNIKSIIESLGDSPIRVDLSSFPELISEIQEAQRRGIEFTEKHIPDPKEVSETT